MIKKMDRLQRENMIFQHKIDDASKKDNIEGVYKEMPQPNDNNNAYQVLPLSFVFYSVTDDIFAVQ